MGWVFMLLGSLAGAALSGGVTYASMLAREKIVVQGAVATERNAGIGRCNARVGEIERAFNADADQKVDDALKAAGLVLPTPEAKAEIDALCKADPACRRAQ